MRYHLQFDSVHEQLIHVEISTQAKGAAYLDFVLPRFRPGRYELQQYEKFVSNVEARNAKGEKLGVEKQSRNEWRVWVKGGDELVLSYDFYANRPDGGGSFLDERYLYLNGVNLFMYRKELMHEACELQMDIPANYQVACSLEREGNVWYASDFHQLVDAPVMASASLQHHRFECEGVGMNIWFMGECRPHWPQLEADFLGYSKAQILLFGEFPVPEYHYLCFMLPHHARHGVEHHASTVIAMGPDYALHQPDFYKSFLEICSHELFHTWNVKVLRPADMYPYVYDRENYSKLHYITEGVTTYYGDLMLWKGDVWDFPTWVTSLNGELNRHYKMAGKDFVSLEEASFDSWITGYNNSGTPNRKISFYTKGHLVAFLLDWHIRKLTENRYGLDDVVYEMYQRIAKQGRGYTKEDYQSIAEELTGQKLDDFFTKYVEGSEDLHAALAEVADYLGLTLKWKPTGQFSDAFFGFRVDKEGNQLKVLAVRPDSPAMKAGLRKDAILLSVEHIKIEDNLGQLLAYFSDRHSIKLHYFEHERLKEVVLFRDSSYRGGMMPQFSVKEDPTEAQVANRQAWQWVKVKPKAKEHDAQHQLKANQSRKS